MRRAVPGLLPGLLIGLGLALAAPVASAQIIITPNPANTAAIAAGKEALAAMEQELASVRTAITGMETGTRQAHAYKVYALWLEGQLALGQESFGAAHKPALPLLEAKGAEAKTELAAARTYTDGLRQEYIGRLSSVPLDKRTEAKAPLEAMLQAESSQISVATQLADDFDKVKQSLAEGLKPYALFNARQQMNVQARDMYAKAMADYSAGEDSLKKLQP